tara:strand:- start:23 stop:1093 length:1071 start_codon:yes stop_codon:yes gene_type:complete
MNFFKKNKKYTYIAFIVLILNLIQFSTYKVVASIYKINNISVSETYDLNFDKLKVIDKAFNKAFLQLLNKTIKSEDIVKVLNFKIHEVKKIIDSFEIVEENFSDNNYSSVINVSFQKKKFLNFIEKKNIFSSVPRNKKIFFLPVYISTEKKIIKLFSENDYYNNWVNFSEDTHLIKYILPNEDLEDLIILKKNLENIADYNFKEIVKKYDLSDYIILITFENDDSVNTLSKISINNENILIRKQYTLNNASSYDQIIKNLKINYEDEWKKLNTINTSIKLNIRLSVKLSDYKTINNLEKQLNKIDLVSIFKIEKISNDKVIYKVTYNGTPNKFLKDLINNNFVVDKTGEIWKLNRN